MIRERNLGKGFILILLPVMAFLLISIFPFSLSQMEMASSTPFNSGWTLSGDDKESKIELPAVIQGISENSPVSLSHLLPEISKDTSLFFKAEQQYVKVKVEDKLIYDYHPQAKWFGHSPGSSIHRVKLSHEYSGKILTIELQSPYKAFCGIVNQVSIGPESAHILSLFKEDFLPLAASLSILLLGIILIFIYLRLTYARIKNAGIFYLGLFSLFTGIWMTAERKILLIFLNDPVFILNVALISLYCLPVPLLLFIKRSFHPERGRVLFFFSCVYFAFVSAGTLLQITNLLDYVLLIPVFHGLSIAVVLYLFYAGIKEMLAGNKDIRSLFCGCLIFSLFTLANIVFYYLSSTPRMSTTGFLYLGILLFIVFSSSSIGENIFLLRDMQTRNKLLHSLAYTDTLTHLKNRASFDQMIQTISPGLEKDLSITLVVLDINNLKIVNDTLGHTEGDHLLIDGAKILKEALGRLGEIYRIGGDEFAMVIRNTPIVAINEAISELFERIDEYNDHASVFKISMAYGMDSYQKGKDKDLNSVFVRADKAMYRCKINQKHIQVVGSERLPHSFLSNEKK